MLPPLTKIIATLGPAVGDKKQIESLARAGVNIFRLNLSHGVYETLKEWVAAIREVEKELGVYLGVLLDLQGPKMRVGRIKGGSLRLKKGDACVFTVGKPAEGEIPVQYSKFHQAVSPGDRVYLNDGQSCVRVLKVEGKTVETKVTEGGVLSDFKDINLPDAEINESPITAKDRKDLEFGLQIGVDFVALSFVGRGQDIQLLRRLIRSKGGSAEIIAKIERRQAVDRMEEIIEEADAVMVARGDLGVEIPLSEVPVTQNRILKECIKRSRPVIVATQMLESMIENARPTRAEVSDVSNAVMSGADAVMLSGETAVGKHPVAVVKVMVETIREAEKFIKDAKGDQRSDWEGLKNLSIARGVALTAHRMAGWLDARALVVFTESGGTAKTVSSFRPKASIFAFTSKEVQARKLVLIRGAIPFWVDSDISLMEDVGELFRLIKSRRFLKKGDRIIITAGLPLERPGWINVVRVETLP